MKSNINSDDAAAPAAAAADDDDARCMLIGRGRRRRGDSKHFQPIRERSTEAVVMVTTVR